MSAKGFTLREKQEVLGHYDRMIAWAKTQPRADVARKVIMEDAIGESWLGVYCFLCSRYSESCRTCPMISTRYVCGDVDSPWSRMTRSLTWEDWICGAEDLRASVEDAPLRPILRILYAAWITMFGPDSRSSVRYNR